MFEVHVTNSKDVVVHNESEGFDGGFCGEAVVRFLSFEVTRHQFEHVGCGDVATHVDGIGCANAVLVSSWEVQCKQFLLEGK